MTHTTGLKAITERRDHHAKRADERVVLMLFAAMQGVADTYRSGKITQRFSVNGTEFRASYKSYSVSIVSPPRGGKVIATIPLRGVTPIDAQPLIDRALAAVRKAGGRA